MRFRIRFRLATLLLLVTAVCLWLGVVTRRARRQQEALEVLDQPQTIVVFDKPSAPKWARELFGEHYFATAVRCSVWQRRLTDSDMHAIASLGDLNRLALHDVVLSPVQLEKLVGLGNLDDLNLSGSTITDDSLITVRRLTSLAVLDLADTAVTDAGLKQIAPLRCLTHLPAVRWSRRSFCAWSEQSGASRRYTLGHRITSLPG